MRQAAGLDVALRSQGSSTSRLVRVALQGALPSREALASEASCRFLARSELLRDRRPSPQPEAFQQGKGDLKNTLLLKSRSTKKAAVKQESQ